MACSGEVKVSLKEWKNQLPTSNDKADVVIRITLGNRVLIEGEKLQLKQEGEGPPKKVGGAEGGDDGHLAVGEAEGAEQKERASSKAEEKKEKSGDKGGKGKGGGKGGAKGQGGGAAAATVRVWEVKHEVCLTFGKSSSNVLSDMVMYPLLISFSELQPKDKKHKDEKTRLLCQTTLDLLPYVMGNSSSSSSPSSSSNSPTPAGPDVCELILHACVTVEGNAYLVNVVSDERKSMLELEVTAHSDFRMTESNILTMRLRSLHSLPENWQPGSFPYTFTASLPLSSPSLAPPISFTLPQGMLQQPPTRDHTSIPTHWKWPGTVQSSDAAKAAKMEAMALEAESGAWHSQEQAEWREGVEGEKARVSWNTVQRVWLSNDSNMALVTQLSKNALVPLEVGRFTIPTVAGAGSRMGKKNMESEPVLSYHAVAYLDLAPLLYPGTCTMCGAFPLYAYNEADIKAKTGCSQSSTLGSTSDLEDGNKKGGASKPGSSIIPGEVGSGDEGTGPPFEGVKREGDAYEEAKTYVYLELQINTPLIPKRPASVLATRVKSYVPSRSVFPSWEGGVEHAVSQFQDHTATLASQLVQEYRDLCGGQDGGGAEESSEEKHRKFIYYLNSSGKYQGIKEELKRSVVKIVREKYMSEIPGPEDRLQMQQFLSQLYIFLVDQMHAGLKKAFSIVGSPPVVPSPLTSDLMKLFAFEAESSGDYGLAECYHKQRVSAAGKPGCEVWYDYAVFCYLISNFDRAEQCLREAVCADITHIPALLLLGVSCCLSERFTEAEDLFELATTSDPKNVVAWTMRGLYYELVCNKLMQEMCFQDAVKCTEDPEHKTFLKMPTSQSSLASKPHLSSTLKHPSTSSKVSILSGKPGLGQPSAASMQSKAMSRDVSGEMATEGTVKAVSGGRPSSPPAATGSVAEQVASGASLSAPRNSTSTQDPQSGQVEKSGGLGERSGVSVKSEVNLNDETLGTVTTERGEGQGEDPPAVTATATPTGIFLQTTAYLLDLHALKFAEMSLAHGLTSLKDSHSTSHAYLMAEARLRIYRQQYEEAVTCIKQAIVVDIQDSEAWALLGHAHFLSGDEDEAMKAYERTLDYVHPPTSVHLVYIRLAQLYITHRMYSQAKDTYLRACSHTPSALTWRGVGVACYRLGKFEEAEEALCEANILNNQDPEVWAYLAMVCLQAKRPVEAEQALKFAIKAGLNDDKLFSELRVLHKTHAPDVDLVHLPPAHTPSHA